MLCRVGSALRHIAVLRAGEVIPGAAQELCIVCGRGIVPLNERDAGQTSLRTVGSSNLKDCTGPQLVESTLFIRRHRFVPWQRWSGA